MKISLFVQYTRKKIICFLNCNAFAGNQISVGGGGTWLIKVWVGREKVLNTILTLEVFLIFLRISLKIQIYVNKSLWLKYLSLCKT